MSPEKVTFGATIEPAPPALPADARANPLSAFYKHPDARRSMDGAAAADAAAAAAGGAAWLAPPPRAHLDAGDSAADVETGLGHGPRLAPAASASSLSAGAGATPKASVDGRLKECAMWPSQQDMVARKRAHQRAKGCNLFRALGRRQRLYAKLVVAAVVVALAVGLGVGISRAVGGGVWSGNGQSKQIPNS